MSKFFYNISLPLAVQGTFTYSSDIRLEIGFRVLVDFSNRERIGVVIKKVDKPAFKTLKIKKVFDNFEIFNTMVLKISKLSKTFFIFKVLNAGLSTFFITTPILSLLEKSTSTLNPISSLISDE